MSSPRAAASVATRTLCSFARKRSMDCIEDKANEANQSEASEEMGSIPRDKHKCRMKINFPKNQYGQEK